MTTNKPTLYNLIGYSQRRRYKDNEEIKRRMLGEKRRGRKR